MRKIGLELPGCIYLTMTIRSAVFLVAGLALVPIVAIGLATLLFGMIGTYWSLLVAVVYLLGLGWVAGEGMDPEVDQDRPVDFGGPL